MVFLGLLVTENLAILALLKENTTVKTLKDYLSYDHGFLISLNLIQILIFIGGMLVKLVGATWL